LIDYTWENIDRKNLKATLKGQKGLEACFYGKRNGKEYSIISIMKESNLLRQECVGYLCYATKVKAKERKLESILVVCELVDVFPKELPSLPPQKEIDLKLR